MLTREQFLEAVNIYLSSINPEYGNLTWRESSWSSTRRNITHMRSNEESFPIQDVSDASAKLCRFLEVGDNNIHAYGGLHAAFYICDIDELMRKENVQEGVKKILAGDFQHLIGNKRSYDVEEPAESASQRPRGP